MSRPVLFYRRAYNADMKATAFLIRVLDIIDRRDRERGFTTPSWIANEVFPRNHPGWSRSCKCGPYGSTKGSGLVMFMGGYLGKLKTCDPPLVYSRWLDGHAKHWLSADGLDMLEANRHLLEE
jgi:hypothetical protein